MKLPSILLTATLLASLNPIAAAVADEVMVPVGQQGADKAALARPTKGMKMEQVEAKFGAPLSKSTPVGKPPISSWDYPEYCVYFENDRVLHSVLKPTPTETDSATTKAPAPAPTPTPIVTTPTPVATPAPAPATTSVATEPADAAAGDATDEKPGEEDKAAGDEAEDEKTPGPAAK